MIKILNKIFYYLKNLILPFLLLATIYIVLMMYKKLNADPFGENLINFLRIILPFVLLIILLLLNTFLKHDEVRNSFFYNITSFLAILTIFVFCYRSIFDQSLYMWHKSNYDINFTYFTDQITSIKVMLYLLSFANICLIIKGYLKDEKETKEKVTKVKKSLEITE